MGMVLAVLLPAAPSRAQAPTANVRLVAPASDATRSDARQVAVRVLVEARDCSAPPTVTIRGVWRGRTGRALLEISGLQRIVRANPPPVARRTDQLTFRRVRVVRGVARLTAVVVTDWLKPEADRRRCTIALPRLVGTGDAASAAARGLVRLRTPMVIDPPTPAPQRLNSTDYLWACGGGQPATFDCGLAVTAAVPGVARQTNSDPDTPGQTTTGGSDPGDPPDWAKGLLAALAALGVGGVGIAAARQRQRGNGMPEETWDDLARQEYARPQEAISAQASDLTKFGAPVAAFITAILAAFGGWVADAPKGDTVIAVAVIVGIAVGGLFYVFASDFRSRAAVSVARFNNLGELARAEAQATKAAQDAAEAKVKEAEAVAAARSDAADTAKSEAEAAVAKAEQAHKEADARSDDADARVRAADEKVAQVKDELEACRKEGGAGACCGAAACHPARSYLTLGGVDTVVEGRPAKIYAVESDDRDVVRYLVDDAGGGLRWISPSAIKR